MNSSKDHRDPTASYQKPFQMKLNRKGSLVTVHPHPLPSRPPGIFICDLLRMGKTNKRLCPDRTRGPFSVSMAKSNSSAVCDKNGVFCGGWARNSKRQLVLGPTSLYDNKRNKRLPYLYTHTHTRIHGPERGTVKCV